MSENNHPELDYLFWKDEILQVMYWMFGEGISDKVSAVQMEGLLNAAFSELKPHFDKLCAEGLLLATGEADNYSYALTDLGRKEAGQHFANAFQGLQQAGHGECGPDCEFCYGDNGEKLDNCVHNCASSHSHSHHHH